MILIKLKKLEKTWDEYYDSNHITAMKDKNFFKLETDAIIFNFSKKYNQSKKTNSDILELGCGTGYLAKQLLKSLDLNPKKSWNYTGVDFSGTAITKAKNAKLKNCIFIQSDFINFLEETVQKFDYIITQRSIMAILDKKSQEKLIKLIHNHLKPTGIGIFSECTIQSLNKIQKLRKQLSVPKFEKIWHSRYLDENFLEKVFSKIEVIDFSSSFWLITRVIFPYFQKPKHNTLLHKFAANVEQTGNYGLVKIFLVST